MKITVEVPEMKCARCSATAPIQPHLLHMKGQAPQHLREVLSAAVKERVAFTALDDRGSTWEVLTDDRPVGWVKGPNASDLCGPCGKLWAEAGKAFMVPPPPPVLKPILLDEKKEKEKKDEKSTAPAKPKSGRQPINVGSAHFPPTVRRTS